MNTFLNWRKKKWWQQCVVIVIDYLLDEQDGSRELYDRQIRMLMTAPHMQLH